MKTLKLVIIFLIIVIVVNFLVYFGILRYINEKLPVIIKNVILSVEYEKIGGKDVYEKINEIQKEQVKDFLFQYESKNKHEDSDTRTNSSNKLYESENYLTKEQISILKKDVYILGDPNAEITFIEYSDLECPFCKKLHVNGTIDRILNEYDGKVNFIFKHFPLSFHENAQKEHEAAECIGELGGGEKFYKFIDEIFKRTKSNGKGFPISGLRSLAEEIGINGDQFEECLNSGKYTEKVKRQIQEGISLFNIKGTPGNILINNKSGKWEKIPGAYPFEVFKKKIDKLLDQ